MQDFAPHLRNKLDHLPSAPGVYIFHGSEGGRESLQEHHARLLQTLQDLQVVSWPHSGAVALHERHEDLQAFHVVRNWCHLGTVDDLSKAKELDQVNAGFDADAYKILVRPLLEGQHTLIAL
jgi:excinuclease Cho